MANKNRGDFRQLQRLRDNIQKLQDGDMDKFCTDMSKELAARLLALVIPATPVGNYKTEVTMIAKHDSKRHKKGDTYTRRVNNSGKNGGTLRRGWTAKTADAARAGNGYPTAQQIKEHSASLPVAKTGHRYTVEVINPVEYASYVEFGHRQEPGRYVPALGKQLKQGWIVGQYFLTKSEEKLRQHAPGWIDKKLKALLEEALKV